MSTPAKNQIAINTFIQRAIILCTLALTGMLIGATIGFMAMVLVLENTDVLPTLIEDSVSGRPNILRLWFFYLGFVGCGGFIGVLPAIGVGFYFLLRSKNN